MSAEDEHRALTVGLVVLRHARLDPEFKAQLRAILLGAHKEAILEANLKAIKAAAILK